MAGYLVVTLFRSDCWANGGLGKVSYAYRRRRQRDEDQNYLQLGPNGSSHETSRTLAIVAKVFLWGGCDGVARPPRCGARSAPVHRTG